VHRVINYRMGETLSGVLMTFIAGYVMSLGFPESEAKAWEKDLQNQGEVDDYFSLVQMNTFLLAESPVNNKNRNNT
jgi:hypothetical protein